ncbi:MAG: hypothetical protein WCO86_10890, partial [Planctomycetota bacterium]
LYAAVAAFIVLGLAIFAADADAECVACTGKCSAQNLAGSTGCNSGTCEYYYVTCEPCDCFKYPNGLACICR